MAFLNALGGVASLLIVVALGFILSRSGWFPPPCKKLIPRLVTNVALPPFLATTIMTRITRDQLAKLLFGALLPMASMIILFVLAYVYAKITRVPRTRTGVFCVCVSNPNTIFIGIPVNLALFGPDSIPFVLVYYFASTTFFWTVGNYFISRDSSDQTLSLHWQNIVSPPIVGFIFGLCSILLNLSWPPFIITSATMIGELTTPLALLYVGSILADAGKFRIGRDLVGATLGRLAVSPCLLYLLSQLFDLSKFARDVFVVQSALPVILQVAILSGYYNADAEFGSEMVAATTICSAATIPLLMLFL